MEPSGRWGSGSGTAAAIIVPPGAASLRLFRSRLRPPKGDVEAAEVAVEGAHAVNVDAPRVLKADNTSADLVIAKDAKVYNDRNDANPVTFDPTNTSDGGSDGIQNALGSKGVASEALIECTLNADGKIDSIIVLGNTTSTGALTAVKDPLRVRTSVGC